MIASITKNLILFNYPSPRGCPDIEVEPNTKLPKMTSRTPTNRTSCNDHHSTNTDSNSNYPSALQAPTSSNLTPTLTLISDRLKMSAPQTKLDLYTSGTPNGQKSSIILDELGLQYTTHAISLSKNEQKESWYLETINPNGRIPALVDNTPIRPIRIFESGALMLYLTERYDKENKISFEYGSEEYWEAMSWHVWMQSGLGPMQGQANHFYRYAPEKIQYGIDRYQTETKRLYQVLEDRLGRQEKEGLGLWIVGGKYSFVDLNCFCWVNWAEWAGISLQPFPKLQKWLGVINEREAVKRGLDVPEKFELKEKLKTKEGEEEYAKYHSNWVMQGHNEDKEKYR